MRSLPSLGSLDFASSVVALLGGSLASWPEALGAGADENLLASWRWRMPLWTDEDHAKMDAMFEIQCEGKLTCNAVITFRLVEFPNDEFRASMDKMATLLEFPRGALVNG